MVLMNSLYTGGAEFSTLTFYQWLRQQGHQVELVCVKQASPAYDPSQFGFETVQYLPAGSFLKRVQTFGRLVKQFKPDIIHSILFDANMIGRMSRMWKRSFIHLESLVNEMYSDHRLADPNVTRVKLFGYRLLDKVTQRWGVDHFHANGLAVAQHYEKKLGISSNRITIIPRGREANRFVGDEKNREQVRRVLQTKDRFLMIQVARHEYQKGQDVLLEAMASLQEDRHKIQLVMVGREGKLTDVIRKKITASDLDACVTLLGHRTDVSSLLAAADGFVFPSRFEGLPGALIEAEAAGLPIICSDIANNREVAVENRNAFFFKVDDIPQLSQAIRTLLNNKEERNRMGKESLTIFSERFMLTNIHKEMLVLLQKLMMAK